MRGVAFGTTQAFVAEVRLRLDLHTLYSLSSARRQLTSRQDACVHKEDKVTESGELLLVKSIEVKLRKKLKSK